MVSSNTVPSSRALRKLIRIIRSFSCPKIFLNPKSVKGLMKCSSLWLFSFQRQIYSINSTPPKKITIICQSVNIYPSPSPPGARSIFQTTSTTFLGSDSMISNHASHEKNHVNHVLGVELGDFKPRQPREEPRQPRFLIGLGADRKGYIMTYNQKSRYFVLCVCVSFGCIWCGPDWIEQTINSRPKRHAIQSWRAFLGLLIFS